MDFYATAAAVAAKSLPKRCDGKNLLPYLRGEKTGDAHNPVRHKDCGVIYEGELPKTFFYILPILNLRDVHASV
jgi:hypothetical protein